MALISRKFWSVAYDVLEETKKGKDNRAVKSMVTVYDSASAMNHVLELQAKDIIASVKWIKEFFVAVMVGAVIFGIPFVLLKMAGMMDTGISRCVFYSVSLAVFILLWVLLSVRSIINSGRERLVKEVRGAGKWKIVEEKKWERFYSIISR